MHYNDKVIFI